MDKEKLMRQLEDLESANQHMLHELAYLDGLMRSVGFSQGLATVKATARELVEREISDDHPKAA